MKQLTKLAETTLHSGAQMELWTRDESYFLMVDGSQTASSYSHGTEDTMAELAASPVKRANQPTFLIEGLALGFQLKGLINEIVKEKASFTVAEPTDDLITWHETILKDLHPGLLDDPRVSIEPMNALSIARKHPKAFHAILIKSTHARMDLSIAEASDYAAALRQGGLLLVAVNKSDTKLKRTLIKAGLDVNTFQAPVAHKGKQTSHNIILIARKGHFTGFSGSRR